MVNPRLMGYNIENGGILYPERRKRKVWFEIEKRKIENLKSSQKLLYY